MPGPVGVLDHRHGADRHRLAEQVADEAFQRAGDAALAVAPLGDVEGEVMRIRPPVIELRVGLAQHVEFNLARWCAGFHEQLAKRAETAVAAAHLDGLLIGQQHRALMDGNALGAKQ